METKANHLLIGGFVLGILVLGFGFVYWMQNLSGGRSTSYAIVFQGSVAGLTTASQVLFNGVKVGQVTSLAIEEVDSRIRELRKRVREVLADAQSTRPKSDKQESPG